MRQEQYDNTDMRHVKAPSADTPYNTVLKTWARWMTLADQQHTEGQAHPQDVKEFMSCGEAVSVMSDSLPRSQWWALHKAHGLTTVWRCPPHAFADALGDAEATLLPKLMKNIATRRYFH